MNIPLLLEMWSAHQEDRSQWIHKCLNRMDLVERDAVSHEKGKLRLSFQLVKILVYEPNSEYCMEIVNKHIVPENKNFDIINIEKHMHILQQYYHMIDDSLDKKVAKNIRSLIFEELKYLNPKMMLDNRCTWRVYVNLGAMVLKLMKCFRPGMILGELEDTSFKLKDILDKIHSCIDKRESKYYNEKAV